MVVTVIPGSHVDQTVVQWTPTAIALNLASSRRDFPPFPAAAAAAAPMAVAAAGNTIMGPFGAQK
jgi:hypothetical protein